MVSHGSAFPIELPQVPAAAPDRLGFAAGVMVGLTLAAVALQIWLGLHVASVAASWADFAPDSIAASSRLAASDAWRCGVPAATSVALAALLLGRVRRARWYALVAVLAVILAIATYVWANAPWAALAGAVR